MSRNVSSTHRQGDRRPRKPLPWWAWPLAMIFFLLMTMWALSMKAESAAPEQVTVTPTRIRPPTAQPTGVGSTVTPTPLSMTPTVTPTPSATPRLCRHEVLSTQAPVVTNRVYLPVLVANAEQPPDFVQLVVDQYVNAEGNGVFVVEGHVPATLRLRVILFGPRDDSIGLTLYNEEVRGVFYPRFVSLKGAESGEYYVTASLLVDGQSFLTRRSAKIRVPDCP